MSIISPSRLSTLPHPLLSPSPLSFSHPTPLPSPTLSLPFSPPSPLLPSPLLPPLQELFKALFKMLSPLMSNSKETQATLMGAYVNALSRQKSRCYKMKTSTASHTCQDSMMKSRFNDWFSLITKFPLSLYFQEQLLGASHFKTVGLPKGKDFCERIPHAMWHRKSNEMLATLAVDVGDLRSQVMRKNCIMI